MISYAAKRMIRLVCTGFLLGSGLLYAGCVRVDAARDTREGVRMLVTRDIKGVHLQWESEAGMGYTVYYRDPRIPNDKWKELPGAVKINGTGEVIRLTDDSPNAHTRKYRIETLEPVRKIK